MELEQHPRQIIRAKITDILRRGATQAGERVFDSRDFTLNTDSTPAIIVYTQEERLDEQEDQDFGLRRRIMTVSIECYHVGLLGAEAVDAMAWQAENLLHANPTLDGLVERCTMQSTSIAFADDGEETLYAALLLFEVTYCTQLYDDGGGALPKTVLAGFAPEVGPPHKGDYIVVAGKNADNT